jgi:hypothetical protein
MGEGQEILLRFDQAGVLVRTDDERLSGPLREYLSRHLVKQCPAQAELSLKYKKILSPIPTHARPALRYYGLKAFMLNGRTYFTDFRSYLTLEPDGKKAEGFISPETIEESGMHFFTHVFFTIALFELLRHHGVFFLHSAGMVSPEGNSYIFPASAGQGKSTLVVYLLREGYKYLSDDTLFLANGAGKVRVTGFEKLSHLPEEVVERFEELKPFLNAPRLNGKGKKLVDLDLAFPKQRLSRSTGEGAIVFLNKVDAADSALRPLSKLEAFHLLLGQSPFAYVNPALAQSHFDLFSEFLAENRVWALDSGRDWMENPKALTDLLERAVSKGGRS